MGMIDTLWNAQTDPEYCERLAIAVYLENLWRHRRSMLFIVKEYSLKDSIKDLRKRGDEWSKKLGRIPDNDEEIWELIDKYPVPRCK